MVWLELSIRDSVWARYPLGLRFPRMFKDAYPLRGKGIVSKILFVLNQLRLDRLLLRHVETDEATMPFNNVAYFYPAPSRSTDRYYGYRVEGGRVVGYLKFGLDENECATIQRESHNVEIAQKILNGYVRIPRLIGIATQGCLPFYAEYEALTETMDVPVDREDGKWFEQIEFVRKVLSSAEYIHGDFEWHNFKISNGALWLLDWEEMRKISADHPELVDQISFWTALAYYNHKTPLDEIWCKFKDRYFKTPSTKAQAIAAVRSMASRKIAMGEALLNCLEKEKKL